MIVKRAGTTSAFIILAGGRWWYQLHPDADADVDVFNHVAMGSQLHINIFGGHHANDAEFDESLFFADFLWSEHL